MRILRRRVFTTVVAVVAALTTTSGAGPADAGTRPAAAPSVVIAANDPAIRYLGRWGRTGGVEWTVNSGSRIVLGFTGRRLVGLFDQVGTTFPPQIYASVDGSPARLFTVDRDRVDLAPAGLSGGTHTLLLAVKDVDERANRWTPPLLSGLGVSGFELAAGSQAVPVTTPSGPRVEFLGDSITQGVRAVGPQIGVDGSDATNDYAWLTGTALGGNFAQVGFGAQGITRPGGGGVPAAPDALAYNYAGSPIDTSFVPDAVVVNQGTNDALGGVTGSTFRVAYLAYLREIRSRWPHALIFAMRPFGGYESSEIRAAVHGAADPRIVYVDTTGWVPKQELTDGLHPTVVGHRTAAGRLTQFIAARTGWSTLPVPAGTAPLLAAGAATGFEGAGQVTWKPGAFVSDVAVAVGASAYQGSAGLHVSSTQAPLGEWRTVSFQAPGGVALPARAKNIYAFVSVLDPSVTTYDVRVRAVRGGRTYVHTTYDILNLTGFLPWDRVAVDAPGSGSLTAMSVSVRAEGLSGTSGQLSFALDDVGWTDTSNLTTSLRLPRGTHLLPVH